MTDQTIRLTGRLICRDAAELAVLQTYLPAHIRLSREEPGCLSFTVTQSDDPLIWLVAESFVDQAAFDAHQARTRASDWWAASAGITRDFQRSGPAQAAALAKDAPAIKA